MTAKTIQKKVTYDRIALPNCLIVIIICETIFLKGRSYHTLTQHMKRA